MKKIIVNGVFDLLHVGHIALLNFAKSKGNFLVVAIDSDERVKQLKGHTRPINNQHERKIILENLKAVDEVIIFNTNEELLNIIKTCNLMIKGDDYFDKPIIGKETIEIIFFKVLDAYSTTKKIESITAR
jgi:D-beta-D-heptose 7-phosphate kinase/D-beta-D-heptose 1-phosphate adenosyltransferase